MTENCEHKQSLSIWKAGWTLKLECKIYLISELETAWTYITSNIHEFVIGHGKGKVLKVYGYSTTRKGSEIADITCKLEIYTTIRVALNYPIMNEFIRNKVLGFSYPNFSSVALIKPKKQSSINSPIAESGLVEIIQIQPDKLILYNSEGFSRKLENILQHSANSTLYN